MIQPDPNDKWRVRRRIIILSLLAIAGGNGVVLATGLDTAAAEAFVTNSLWLAGMIIGSYVFGATWDDKSQRGK